MALEIRKQGAAMSALVADRRLYVDKDRTRLVEDGSIEAAFLLATPGTPITSADVVALGLEMIDGRVVQQPEASEVVETEVEQQPKSRRTKKQNGE